MAKAAVKTAVENHVSPPTVEQVLDTSSTPETSYDLEIAILAYQLWEERGRPPGDPDHDWYEAERVVKSRNGG